MTKSRFISLPLTAAVLALAAVPGAAFAATNSDDNPSASCRKAGGTHIEYLRAGTGPGAGGSIIAI
jgi:hypothetical protein